MDLVLFGLYVLGVALTGGVLSFLTWYWYDQRYSWVVYFNPNTGNAGWGKKRVARNELNFKEGGKTCVVPLRPALSFYKRGYRSGRVYVVDVAAGVQLYPSAVQDDHIDKPGWKLGALIDSNLDEMLLRMSRGAKPFFSSPIVVVAALGLLAVIAYGVLSGG